MVAIVAGRGTAKEGVYPTTLDGEIGIGGARDEVRGPAFEKFRNKAP
jgi:hypothetical protein